MFKRIYFFFLTYLIVGVYSYSLLLVWLSKNGLSEIGIIIYYFFQFLLTLFLYFVLQGRNISSRQSLALGIIVNALGTFFISFMSSIYYAFILAIPVALTNIFFWTMYNTLHFKYSKKEESGSHSGIYFLFFPIVGAIFSPLAGYVVEHMGYVFLFRSGAILYIIPLMFVLFLPNFNFQFRTKEASILIENKILIFLQGCISVFSFTLIPIFTMFFVKTPFEYGKFFGYLAIISTFVAFFNSKLSDKLKKRAFFFYFFTILDSITYIPLAFVKSLAGWHIFAGISNIGSNLANPFSVALVLDHAKGDIALTMLGREIYLCLGRVVMFLFIIAVFYITHSFQSVLMLSAFVTLLYPIFIYYNRVYLK
jgi:MFS family permease